MHHWCTKTCHSFSRKGSELFRDHVAKEAFQHDYLLHAVFALTLLHQASDADNPNSARPLVDAALQHQNLAAYGLSQKLDAVTPFNCDAVFMCSVLIMVCAIVSPLVPTSTDEQPQNSSHETVRILLNMMTGISSVVNLTRPWISQGPLHKFFSIVERGPLHEAKRADSPYSGNWPAAMDLRHLVDSQFNGSAGDQDLLYNAIDGLEGVATGEICAVSWIMNYGTNLVESLENGDSLTVMVFMHWSMLLCTTDEMWWKKYAGARLVQELSASFAGRGQHMERMSRSCQRKAGLHGLWSCPGSYLFGA